MNTLQGNREVSVDDVYAKRRRREMHRAVRTVLRPLKLPLNSTQVQRSGAILQCSAITMKLLFRVGITSPSRALNAMAADLLLPAAGSYDNGDLMGIRVP